MSSNPSNMYAEKVYAEQPISLWSLDDDCTFISFLPTLALNSWTLSSGSFQATSSTTYPFPQIEGASFVRISSPGSFTLTSAEVFSSSETFSAGLWVNPQSAISSIKFTVGTQEKVFSLSGILDKWVYLSHIFETSSGSPITSQHFVITATSTTSITNLCMSGFSIGINQHFFGTVDVGNNLSSIANPNIGLYGVKAYEYGLGENNGWYIGNNTSKKLYSKNFSMPLVYGSRSSTILYPNSQGPSLIVPGLGFLNKSSSGNILTAEFWTRIKSDASSQGSPVKIFGPISSSDGLYVDGQHLTLKIGNSIASHYVGEWFRPMLIDIEYTPQSIVLFVNGENVCSIALDSSIALSDVEDDFLGFYAGGSVDFVEIDCIAIYPYRVNSPMLKRRFAYGQAVQYPSEIETGYSGKQYAIDYTYAGYSSDYSYPNVESWSSSLTDNVYINNSIIGSPQHSYPDIVIGGSSKTSSQWISENNNANIKMRPSSEWSTANTYLYMDKIQQSGMPQVSSIFMSCIPDASYSDQDQVLLKIKNNDTSDSITIVLSNTEIKYLYDIAGEHGTISTQTIASSSTAFNVGLEFSSLEYISSNFSRFISGINRCSLFIGGDYSGEDITMSTTFAGSILKFGICTNANAAHEQVSSLFTNGIADKYEDFSNINPSYGLQSLSKTFLQDTVYSPEISSSSYWQDYIPLSKFAKKSFDGSYKTNMVQISVDVARPYTISTIDNVDYIDTSSSDIKTYVYFVNNSDISNISSFGAGDILNLTTEKIKTTLVVDATTWSGKKFEVVDGAVIILPTTNQDSISMVTLIEMHTKSTEKYPIKVRSLEYAAQTFNNTSSALFDKSLAKKIGTRSATSPVYMFAYENNEFAYDGYNPVSISKSSTPYLYLTSKTGVKVLDAYGTNTDRGIFIPVNESGQESYIVSLVSMSALYDDQSFSDGMVMIDMYGSGFAARRRLVANKLSLDSSKAYLSMQYYNGSSWIDLPGVKIYINGTYMPVATISSGEWSTIAIYFTASSLFHANNLGQYSIEVVGSFVLNNLSLYKLRPEEESSQISFTQWNDIPSGYDWADVLSNYATWEDLAVSQSLLDPTLIPSSIFDIYTGTNKVISVGAEDSSGIGVSGYQYDIIEEVIWQQPVTIST